MSKIIRVCSALVACAVMTTAFGAQSAPASQAEPDRRDTVKFKFQYEASDLATREGAEKVYRRLVRVVRRQCTPAGTLAAELRRVDQRCISEMTSNAVARMGSAHLAAIHQGVDRSGERVEVVSTR